MTLLSTTAVGYLAERLVRQHAPIEPGALVVLLAALDIPAPRAHAGIHRAIDRGAISLTNADRQVLIVADPNLPARSNATNDNERPIFTTTETNTR